MSPPPPRPPPRRACSARFPGSPGRGFTLIELLVTLVIIGTVVTLAVGGYRQYTRRAARVDGTSALLRLAAAQEKFYLQNGRYADQAEMEPAPPAGLGIVGSERGYYALAIEPADAGIAIGYTASATVDPDRSPADDADCWTFSMNERGLRTASTRDGATGTEITERCWR
jgi:type IV pilus assembly protein PilE